MVEGVKNKVESTGSATLAENRSARSNYEIIDTHEAGLSLLGSEVKSIRAGGANLKESYIRVQGGQLFLLNCHVTPYRFSRAETINATRERRLLMHRAEIEKLDVQVRQKGLTLIPLKLYLKQGRIKLSLAVARGKKLHDKREDIKKKEADREISRALKGR